MRAAGLGRLPGLFAHSLFLDRRRGLGCPPRAPRGLGGAEAWSKRAPESMERGLAQPGGRRATERINKCFCFVFPGAVLWMGLLDQPANGLPKPIGCKNPSGP